MPNIKSMKKDVRRNAKRRARNQSLRSALKTYVKKLRLVAQTGTPEEVAAAERLVQKWMDKAAQRGVIHKNQAARRKSRAIKAAKAALASRSES